jgi:hypothetical protein
MHLFLVPHFKYYLMLLVHPLMLYRVPMLRTVRNGTLVDCDVMNQATLEIELRDNPLQLERLNNTFPCNYPESKNV